MRQAQQAGRSHEISSEALETLDVVIVGAGISGIGAAWHLQTTCPGLSYAILEARDAIGGTWDLFRYPGIRSDSDMYTLGFPFRPWSGDASIADGASIRRYVQETAAAFGIDRRVRYRHRVMAADFDHATGHWTLAVDADGAPRRLRCAFLYVCAGYYDYAEGHQPDWPGREAFAGSFVHPQHWPQDLDHAGKRVVVIGSGATAVTLVPAMAATAAHVTMLQRSPGYLFSLPTRDPLAGWLRRRLPERAGARLARWAGLLQGMGFYMASKRFPRFVGRKLTEAAARAMGPAVDPARDLAPRYGPWDERMCFVPDGDFFQAVRSGKASIVTDEIARFTPTGIELASGRRLDADIVVSATGLKLRLMGGMELSVDGRPVRLDETLTYKGMMLSGVPNLAFTVGYTNASWTLKCDLTWSLACRILNRMREKGATICVAEAPPGMATDRPLVDLPSGYIRRAAPHLPKQGRRSPWTIRQNYIADLIETRFTRVEDGILQFRRASAAGSRNEAA